MSVESTNPAADASLSKEEKKQRKEAKRAKKAAAAAESAPAEAGPSTAVPAEASEGLSKEDKKKRKEEKKRKRAAEVTVAEPETSAVQPSKKSKSETTADIPTTFTSEHNDYLTAQGITLTPSLFPPILDIPSLPVSSSIQKFLSRFPKPTPIQACAWPPLLAGRDVVGVAETGSGKTLGFGVPGLHFLSTLPKGAEGGKKKRKGAMGVIQLLVLAPTRELALQSHETLSELGKAMGIESVCLYGGVGKDAQLGALAKGETRIVVGTPGRVLDLADSGDMDLST